MYANYLVYQDDRPFLIVNSTLEHVRHLVERFARSGHNFRFQAC
jgi:hypothetical protein